jgi:hypothetical protein
VSEEAFVSLEKEFGVKGWTIELSSPDKTPHPTGTPLLKGGTRGGYELQTKRTYYKLSA